MINDYLSLSSRAGFNKSLGHFRMVTDIVKRMKQGDNLANVIDSLEKDKGVQKSQIGPILNAIVIDRLAYAARSFNLPVDVRGFEPLRAEIEKWNRLDIIIAYHHPQLGITLINPKDKAHWTVVQELDRDELLVLYVLAVEEGDKGLESAALGALHNLLIGKPAGDTQRFGGAAPKPTAAPLPVRPAAPAPQTAPPPFAPQARLAATPAVAPQAAPQAAAPQAAAEPARPSTGGPVRMTPKYSVQVTNELFHNGNVEAWKNIVESYKTKFPGIDVHIFHDGQKVNNINALFKWGKVNHGDVLLFCVSGEEIKGVAKLQRYLFEGASQRYENYLKKDVNKVLTLF